MYRFVHHSELDDPNLRLDFLSDAERSEVPVNKRERQYPEILDGMSMYTSEETALVRWRRSRAIAVERDEAMIIGAFVAEVELVPGQGFDVEDLHDPFGHLTIWGDPALLSGATRRIYAPDTDEG